MASSMHPPFSRPGAVSALDLIPTSLSMQRLNCASSSTLSGWHDARGMLSAPTRNQQGALSSTAPSPEDHRLLDLRAALPAGMQPTLSVSTPGTARLRADRAMHFLTAGSLVPHVLLWIASGPAAARL